MARTSHARLTLLAASLLAAFAGQALAAPAVQGQNNAIARLKAANGNAVDVAIHPATGAARFVRVAPPSGAPAGVAAKAGVTAARAAVPNDAARQDAALRFVTEYGALFGVTNAATELAAARVTTDRLGHSLVARQQVYKGVPVFGAELRTHFDARGTLTAVNGTFVPGINLDVAPRRTADQASAVALAAVKAAVGQQVKLATSTPQLMVYREGLLRGVEGANRLVWQVTVGNGTNVREFLFVDAHSGKVVEQFTGIHDALNRRAFDGANSPDAPGPNYPTKPKWVEGDTLPTGVTEADNMIYASGEIHSLFSKAFGYDSFNGKGARMDSIYDRGWGCVNASWNGTYISFCPETTTDDVTAHEWGHAYTEYTHGLIYAWQQGALNEAYSDIWGETVDRINNRDGSGGTADALRTAGSCAVSTSAPPALSINSPSTITSPAAVGGGTFGPQSFNLTGNVALANPLLGGTALASNVSGKIALLQRGGGIAFTTKTKNAQAAGAIGAIIFDNVTAGVAGMSGSDPDITIPAVRITLAEGTAIKNALDAGTTVNVTLSRGNGTDNSVRWLMGEDSAAFGGAIRDMYNPRCYSQPAKVTDGLYFCAAQASGDTDNGGVHFNSGVPNHAYALLVDGGTFNGQTINPIGITKAAHIYWRAQSVYQGPTTDFAGHADALEASCADLTGSNLNSLTTGSPSGEVITAGDCAQVAKAMLAVEMRTPPSQCSFQPLLAKNPPPLCPSGTVTSILADGFDGGRKAGVKWTVSNNPGNTNTFLQRNFGVTNAIPPGRTGYAMYAPAPDFSCTSSQAGVLHLDSPEFTVPVGATTLRMSFDHWMASEATWDGGNVKISVNNGPWQLVNAADFVYNPYNLTLKTAAAGSDNPLAGQPAFSGTDSNQLSSSWGRSIINLAPYAAPGAKVRLRFDMGTDFCSGNTGWFIDDVNVYSCKP